MKKDLSLKEVQKCELEILKKTVYFLDNNNIQYYIWAGSFLGAVRHGGFIPWDDDIDIAMERTEYNKFISLLKNEKAKIDTNIDVIGFELKNDIWPFLKVIDKNVGVEEDDGVDSNLWIDVFPLDGAPNNKLYYLKLKFLKRLFFLKRNQTMKLKNAEQLKIRLISKRIIKLLIKFISIKSIVALLVKESSKYNCYEIGYFSNNIWGVYDKEKFESTALKKVKKYKFEDIEVYGLLDSDGWLKIRYGNYMSLPPVEKRQTHKFKAWKVK